MVFSKFQVKIILRFVVFCILKLLKKKKEKVTKCSLSVLTAFLKSKHQGKVVIVWHTGMSDFETFGTKVIGLDTLQPA